MTTAPAAPRPDLRLVGTGTDPDGLAAERERAAARRRSMARHPALRGRPDHPALRDPRTELRLVTGG